ncbi:NAK/BIKE protein kinase [Spizellomyces punctatus DAOM BR117]|uniref:non-specific serine/threonine protein kinase n=1 Tax=Spizellomyces punctatus (strain DAOM BR117) TaxID=645134 RepID=A0A0L0HG94_SPIPD|nr:NAK/BIKE protein kinase [Spizellomyces punctatus DAOM BR117]KNC99838.1 NAK/BIKE protein kinase [Spizellomyces punctatus DAOM BR117]|eukprot:XP_016607878.1 NAK/BIKE protein kinase [Spizellomyces punctatus DAOM BR117]
MNFFNKAQLPQTRPASGGGAGNRGMPSGHAHRTSASNLAVSPAPPGTYAPGTVLSVNATKVVVERFLAQGGFAHVYVVLVGNEQFQAVLKRGACPDQESLKDLEKEIHFMRQLNGHKNIVKYVDSSIQKARNGGFEVFILMEYCRGGHLVDFLNTRLSNRLTEPEILTIFSDVCEAVAHMHYSNPPIIHRDIKVENVLIANDGYKLCDFGSATTQIVLPGTSMSAADIRLLEDEIGKYTTLQYRAPELCDLYQKRGLTEKMDMWALGVLLYKLCFFTTPFEDSGTLAILNVRYTMPSHPSYSRNLLNLIELMLVADVSARADIYQIYSTVCRLRGLPCTLRNKYADGPSTHSTSRTNTPPHTPFGDQSAHTDARRLSSNISSPTTLNNMSASTPDLMTLSSNPNLATQQVMPMRRGRPPKHGKTLSNSTNVADLTASVSLLNVSSPHNPFAESRSVSSNRLTAPPEFFNNADLSAPKPGNVNRLTAPPEFFDRVEGFGAQPGKMFSPGTFPAGEAFQGSASDPFSVVDRQPVQQQQDQRVNHQQQRQQQPRVNFQQQEDQQPQFNPFDPFRPVPLRRDTTRSIPDLKINTTTPSIPSPLPSNLFSPQRPFQKSTSEIRLNAVDLSTRIHGHSRNKSWAQGRSPGDASGSESASRESLNSSGSSFGVNVAGLVRQFHQMEGAGATPHVRAGVDGRDRSGYATGPPRLRRDFSNSLDLVHPHRLFSRSIFNWHCQRVGTDAWSNTYYSPIRSHISLTHAAADNVRPPTTQTTPRNCAIPAT